MKNPFFTLLLPLCFSACGVAQSGAAKNTPVTIRFQGRLADQVFACGKQYQGVGSNATTVTPADLRFFVSNLGLIAADGSTTPITLDQDGLWQYKSVALIDLEDGSGGCRNGNSAIHSEVTGTVAPGSYVGLRFTLGVPFELDHLDDTAAPSPLNMTAMQWNWQNGYKFLRAEITIVHPNNLAGIPSGAKESVERDKPASAPGSTKVHSKVSGFPVHLGSTGCASSGPRSAPAGECKNPNRPVITLPEFHPEKDAVVFDMGNLLADSDVTTNAPNTAPGCMSFEGDADCVSIMEALGIPYGGAPAKPQVVFYRRTE